MSQDQDYLNNVSLKLSEVLSDIGVNERMVLKRRRMTMLQERMRTTMQRVQGYTYSSFHFGSQSEGTTTRGLQSDIDLLVSVNRVNVIQDWSKWRPGRRNMLMIQDETTSPGYCLLQVLRRDVPLPLVGHIQEPDRYVVSRGKVLCKNSFFNHLIKQGDVINGPAQTHISEAKATDSPLEGDFVSAFVHQSWPLEALPWLERQGIGGWPTEEMKRYCVNTGCYVVPVASKSGHNKETEWRISTSHAERYLMYSLNITQIRCYILMKMILKTLINPQCNGVISSFMCKTVLFHCIQNTHSHWWQENNLLPCLTQCMLKLQHFIREEKCPHFIILENNLMAERISHPVKHQLIQILQQIIQSNGHVLLQIPYDDLGTRLQVKMNIIPSAIYLSPNLVSTRISNQLLVHTASMLSILHKAHLKQMMCCRNDTARLTLSGFIFSLARVYMIPDVSCSFQLKNSVWELLFPLLSSSLGSVIASSDIHMNNTISQQSFAWFSAGLNSDISSGRLKLASALYCVGETEKTEFVLRNIEDQYDQHNILPICGCTNPVTYYAKVGLGIRTKSNTGNEEMIKQITAFCVTFMESEKDCVPKELQYEMFRSTEDERLHRDDDNDYWMDWAEVDPLPYLYFLQYKTYGRLQRVAGQQCALTNLATTIDTEPNLRHRETALNLLGQCLEQENRHNDALRCYVRSLNIRPRNNAAKIHICRLLNSLVNRHVQEQ